MAIIYFDQWVWINLLKGHKGIKGYEDLNEIYEKVLETSNSGKHKFPLSACHIIETLKRGDDKSREELFEFMFTSSKFFSIRPHTTMNDLEIISAISKELNIPTSDLRMFVFSTGLGHCFNSKEIFKDKITGKPVSNEEREDLLKKIYQPKLMSGLFSSTHLKEHADKMKKEDEKLRIRLEKLRKSEYCSPDKRRKKDIADARFIITELKEPLVRGIINHPHRGIDTEEFISKILSSIAKFESFFKNIPCMYTFHTLNYIRNTNTSRSIKSNDTYDLSALSIAVPYCDIVVTEKEWASTLNKKKFGEIYDTKIISRIQDLNSII